MSVKLILPIACLLVFLTSCLSNGPGAIRPVTGSAFPVFEISGSGNVQWIWFQGPYQNPSDPGPELKSEPDPKNHILWKIAPADGRFVPIESIPTITYGQVPQTWKQQIPESGPPPPFLDGYVYYIGVVPERGTGAQLCVFLKNGQMQPYRDPTSSSVCGKN